MEFIAVYAGFTGLFIGSFLNVLIDRLPYGRNVLTDRSACDYCKKKLRWFELVPVLSFVLQKGRCRRCHAKLSFRYPASELVTGILFFLIAWQTYPNILLLLAGCIIASCLLVLTVIDIKHYLLPDSLILTAVLAQLIYIGTSEPHTVVYRILSGLGAFFFLWAIWFFTKGKGMGFGDVKFAFFLGLSLGFPSIIVALYIAFLTGAVIGIILIVKRKKSAKTQIPFGPFLVWGYCIALLYGPNLIRYFLHL